MQACRGNYSDHSPRLLALVLAAQVASALPSPPTADHLARAKGPSARATVSLAHNAVRNLALSVVWSGAAFGDDSSLDRSRRRRSARLA